jgi:hypothetical protein
VTLFTDCSTAAQQRLTYLLSGVQALKQSCVELKLSRPGAISVPEISATKASR